MDWKAIFWIALTATMFVVIAAHGMRKAALVRRLLREFAAAAGLTDVRHSILHTSELFARWGGLAVSLRWMPAYKTAPQSLTTTVRVQAGSARMIVTRRGYEWFERPFSLLGPPLVEPPGANRFWVRTNEPAVAHVMFADAALVRLLEQNVGESFDRLALSGDGMQIRRVVCVEKLGETVEQEWALVLRALDVLRLSPLV